MSQTDEKLENRQFNQWTLLSEKLLKIIAACIKTSLAQ